ncbi:hypothetical protein M8C13_03720 [Crossiella sp. SN42]|uniref:hypothetical protein n=1 Tax=Crossiella sp. SN42 TaxID=2944808 RepID=UPI00207CDB09|nr:hypothetical protein [Crossiella sp. SN42]MCO1574867.1 hypothetical protein [Crossiella sp. SN42]
MAESQVREWAEGEWRERVSVAPLGGLKLRYRVRGRRLDGSARWSREGTPDLPLEAEDLLLALSWHAVFLWFVELLLRVFGWLGRLLLLRLGRGRVLTVLARPGTHAVRFADAARPPDGVWAAWSMRRMALVRCGPETCEPLWQGSGEAAPRLERNALCWADGSRLRAPHRVFQD